MMALFTGPLNFYKLVYISVMTSTLYNLLETSVSPFIVDVKSQDFEYIVSWKGGNNTGTPPPCYHVKYKTIPRFICLNGTQSKSLEGGQVPDVSSSKSRSQQSEAPDHHIPGPGKLPPCPTATGPSVSWETGIGRLPKSGLKTVVECSNIRRSFCNLTKEFTDPCKLYVIFVEQVTETGAVFSYKDFIPYLNTCLAPSHFTISACPNCINVTVKLSSSLLKIYQELDYKITVTKEDFKQEYSSKNSRQEISHSVIENLQPNTNYCIAVDVSSTVVKQCAPSPLKCIVTGSKNKSALNIMPAFIGIFIPLAVGVTLLVLHRAGVFCLKMPKWPKALKFIPRLAYSIFESDPEEVHTVQVTQKNNKKVSGDNSDDDSESDIENENFYSKRNFLGKISEPCSEVDIVEQLSIDCSSTTTEIAEPLCDMAENLQNDINKEESPTSQVFPPSSEVNTSSEPETEEHSSCLNVNLNTVMLGMADEMWDVSATPVAETEEEATDLKDSGVSYEYESDHFTDIPYIKSFGVDNLSCAWQNSSGSGGTETSDSEPDCVGDYMSR